MLALVHLAAPWRRRRRRRVALEQAGGGVRFATVREAARLGPDHPLRDEAIELASQLAGRALPCAARAGGLCLALAVYPTAVRVEVRADSALRALFATGAGTRAVDGHASVDRLATRRDFTHDQRAGVMVEPIDDLGDHR